ncbi:ABC transporter ATP-binding protein [Zafaria sp. Z1313]|uniref:ABC transporter ATP-binding protein n=1 Tax=unclassified Zafaria TaxID=2828765 RepID=UPI002E76A82D|nr:ABC transporter ATP-binding protein [Zafaria sp. J156]MEE1620528.1 ABC transporter ATP-binding protein [Zafaria sp. J156]
MSGPVALRAEGLNRSYGSGEAAVHAVRDVDLAVHAGELMVVRGPSGSGKTTLLNCLGGLDAPDSGRVWLRGGDGAERELTAMDEPGRVALRQRDLGFIFQSFGLLPILTAAENVEVPLRIARWDAPARRERVDELLRLVGLEKHRNQRPSELSGGQQQRVGTARALANRPAVIIADEPTGQLDSRTAATIMDLLGTLVREQGVAAVVSTHDPLMIQRADTVLELHDGRITA